MAKNRRALSGDIESKITIDGDMEIPKAYSNINQLSDLSDVDTTGVADNYILKYDAEIEKWVAGEGGSSITIDNEMSDESENPVQNKVIKAYVDEHAPQIEVDDEMSDESENAVQNKVIKAYVDDSQPKQELTDEDVEHPLLFAQADNESQEEETTGIGRNNNVYVNPETGNITAESFNGMCVEVEEYEDEGDTIRVINIF